jgi:hypothetical protein
MPDWPNILVSTGQRLQSPVHKLDPLFIPFGTFGTLWVLNGSLVRAMLFKGASSKAIHNLRCLMPMTKRLDLRRWFQGSKPMPSSLPANPPTPLEEEMFRKFNIPGHYHPVVVGEMFKDHRYSVTRKLGFGVYSTVWLCFDNE